MIGKKAGATAVLLVVCVGLLVIVYRDSIDFQADGWSMRRSLAGATTTDVFNYAEKGKAFNLGFGHRYQTGDEYTNGVDYTLDFLEVSILASENRFRESTAVVSPPNVNMVPDPRVFLNLSLTKRTRRFSAADQRMYVTFEDAYVPTNRGFIGLSLPKSQPKINPATMDGTLSFSYAPPGASYSRGAYWCFWAGGSNDADCTQRVDTEYVSIGSVGAIQIEANFHCTGTKVKNPPLTVYQFCQDTCAPENRDPYTGECMPGTLFTECIKYQDMVHGTTCSSGTGSVTLSTPGIAPLTNVYTGAPVPPDDYYNYISTTISDATHISKYTTTTPVV